MAHEDIIQRLYLAPDEKGWEDIAARVAAIMKDEEQRQAVFVAIREMQFIPSTPMLVNIGRAHRSFAACYVLHVPNSIEGIFETLKTTAIILKSGAGVGLCFDNLAARGTPLKYLTHGYASGPVAFMRAFNACADVLAEGGVRTAAMMGTLNIRHPDIEEFITAKTEVGELRRFNISVTMDELHPGTPAWQQLVAAAWYNGEPGVIFLDRVNANNPTLSDFGRIQAVNACVTGDTLVAVADGRGAVPIQQLAEEGKDVPVYSQSPDGIVIRMGRRPHKVASNAPIVRVTLDDGSSIKVTPDHRFMLRDGTYCRADELIPGMRLMPFYRYQYRNRRQVYWAIHRNDPKQHVRWIPEHCIIAEHVMGRALRDNEVVHHRDFNGLHNTPANLCVMDRGEHTRLHIGLASGDNNPMRRWWSTLSEEERRAYREAMSKRMSGKGNPSYGRPQSVAMRQAISRGVRRYHREHPGAQIQITREQILEWGVQYVRAHGKLPTAATWRAWHVESGACSVPTVQKRFGCWQTFKDGLQQLVEQQNHRVVSVEPCGYADIYDITVDEYHNLAYITNINDTTPAGMPRHSGIITHNCSELPLYGGESCNLASLNLPKVISHLGDYSLLQDTTRLMVDFLDRVIDCNPYPTPDIEVATKRTRRIGIGVMGFATLLEREGIPYDSSDVLDLAHEIALAIALAARGRSAELGAELGGYLPNRPRNVTTMAIAPTGHIHRIAHVSPSIYLPYHVALNMTPAQHIEYVRRWQMWVDGGVSYTVNIPHDAKYGDVDAIFRLAHEGGLKSIAVYRDGSRPGQPLKLGCPGRCPQRGMHRG